MFALVTEHVMHAGTVTVDQGPEHWEGVRHEGHLTAEVDDGHCSYISVSLELQSFWVYRKGLH